MSKRYFAKKKSRWEPKLLLLTGAIACVFALILGLPYLWSHGCSTSQESIVVSDVNAVEALENAYVLMAQGAVEEAEKTLQPVLHTNDPAITPRAVILQADIEHYRGDGDAALQRLSDAAETFRSSKEYPYIEERRARQLEEMDRFDEAQTIYEMLCDNAPTEIRAMGYLGLGRLAERRSEFVAARDLYRHTAEDAPWGDPVWEEAVALMGRINVSMIFSPAETPESRYYTVESGDNLIAIGMKLNTTQGLLITANNIGDVSRLRLGQRLKYTPKDFSIIIERSTCTLYVFDNHGLFKQYKVGLGKPGHETVLGKYAIGNKQQNPVWHKPGAGAIEAGDPTNELGTRWMPMVPADEGLPHDLGIHGTIAPETIGSYSSKGCARMLNSEVEELYDLVVRATAVEVVETIHDHTDAPAETTEIPKDTETSPSAPTKK